MKSPITTHVLDTALGRPAEGITVLLERESGGFREIGRGVTNADGRVADLLEPGGLDAGIYRLTFAVEAYFERTGRRGFYPHVPVVFEVRERDQHFHVPLLLSPYGYSTYRGS